ncbi:LIM-domain binding protein-domain-containing protein [Phascolomyces articulosus]|uniref:LIM-domain binding protein-domain-containing protein n=1 Tax=Phascolomyces articulosus TaxID=60185 RepID=A0AAD5P9J3_9FUNG|nr:LIM-domain binding protein-domain-containing protein [Phascolomyces articulosus]
MVPSSSTDGQLVVQGNQAQLHMIRQRQYFMQQQFAAAAAAAATARSGSGRTTPVMMQQVPPSPAHVQQELSPQPNGLVHNTNNRAAVVPQQQQQASVTPGYPLPTTSLTTGLITNQKLQVTGQAILRLLQFAELISPGAQQAISPIFWKEFVNGFFTESSTFKLGLWSNQKNMQEIYEMTRSSIPGYFHTQYNRCKVISMQLTVQGTDEKLLQDGSITIDCAHTSLIHRYENGGMVVSTGTLSVLFRRRYETNELRIDWMQFKCQRHEEFIERKRVNEIMAKFQPPKAKQFKAQQAAATAAIQSSINEWGVSTILFPILWAGSIT